MNNYNLKIKDIRKIKGVSGAALAHKIGISQSFLSDLENQKYDIKVIMLLQIARAFDICPYKLINFCASCPKNRTLFFKHYDVITVCNHPSNLYNCKWGVNMNEKTTVYLEPDLKEEVKIRLIRDKGNESLSALINELLEKWLKEQK